jgi:adenine/guanine phosphoribosyltransferase-like PRPP-binding protein
MVEQLSAEVVGISAVIDLSFLPWREKLADYDVNCLVSYDSE